MKTPVLVLLLAVSVFLSACESKDVKLQKSLVGTWQDKETTPDGLTIDGTTTYLADGKMKAGGKISFGPKSLAISLSGTWEVKDGFLRWTAQESNIPKLVPVGYSTADKIISVTDTDFTYQDSKTGKTRVEHRVK